MATKKSSRVKKPAALTEAGFADGLDKLYHLESIGDNMGSLSAGVGDMAKAIAASVIAHHGSKDDREKVVAYLKRWFWESGAFEE